MKQLLLSMGFLLSLSTLLAQNYHPFPTSDAQWTMRSYLGGGTPPYGEAIYGHRLMGDTTINGNVYHLVQSYTYANAQSSATYIGGIREDSTKKIWFYSFGLPPTCSFAPNTLDSVYVVGQETMIYDFGLSVGDSVKHPILIRLDGNWVMGIDSATSHVEAIDSIPLLDGTYRRALRIRSDFHDVNAVLGPNPQHVENGSLWVEGIGGLDFIGLSNLGISSTIPYPYSRHSGLFSSFQFSVAGSSPPYCEISINCFKQNGVQLLGVGGVASCDTVISTTLIEGASKPIIELFPNPFHEQATLEVSNGDFRQLKLHLYNTTGQQVAEFQSNSRSVLIQKRGLPVGLYFYKVWGDDKLIGTGKLIAN